jgi:hypothetical protein
VEGETPEAHLPLNRKPEEPDWSISADATCELRKEIYSAYRLFHFTAHGAASPLEALCVGSRSLSFPCYLAARVAR